MLTANAFFSGADAASLVRVLPAFRTVTVPAGSTLYRRGRLARRLFLIVSGSVAIVSRGGGERRVISLLGPGEFTGERALFVPPERHVWSAVCETETRVAVADGAALHALLCTSPHLGLNVARGSYRRIADTASAIEALVAAR